KTMLGGDLRSGGRMCIVGLRLYKDLSASFLAENLNRAGLGVEARSIEVDVRPEQRGDPNALGFARALEEPGFRTELADALAGQLEPEERVGLPAVLGLRDPDTVWSDLEQRLERAGF